VNVKNITRSFAGGEIAPELFGRLDLTKFQTGLAFCRNFEVLPHGPVRNRAGYVYVNEVKFSAKKTVIRPFSFNTTQTYILEFGDQYVRVHTLGATLLGATSKNITGITQANPAVATSVAHGYASGQWLFLQGIGGMTRLNRWVKITVIDADHYSLQDLAGASINTTTYPAYTAGGTSTPPLEVVTPFVEADLFDVHWTQSADVLSLVHPNYAPQELKRLGATNWTLGAISFAPSIGTPAAPGVVATGAGAKNYSYVTTALAANTLEESLPSAATTVANDLTAAGNFNTVTPAGVGGAVRYNIYKLFNGLYGYIGQTDGSAFVDNNVAPDVSQTPAITNTPFGSGSNYPGAVGYYEGRRVFAGTNNKPQGYWATRSGTESNLSYSIPTRDDDTIQGNIIAGEVNRIRHILPLSVLVMLTSGGIWKVFPQNSDVLTPTSARPKQESNDGASNVAPILTGRSVLFPEDATSRVRELRYSIANNTVVFESADVSIMAPHLFDGYTVTDSAYVKAPHKIAYFVRNDGKLLGLTHLPEQQISAWHQHDTLGKFESTAAVKEGTEFPLYVLVNRTINGRTVRYIERQHTRMFTQQADAFFVDAGVSYSGAAVSTISGGLWHLEGQTVSVLADGGEHPQVQVTDGTITLERTASTIQIGLPYTSQLQTLPFTYETQAFGQGVKKVAGEVWFRVKDSETIAAGPSFDRLREYPARSNENWDTPPHLKTDELHLTLDSRWGSSAQICVQQDKPLPLEVLSMIASVSIGG
jgi:hypothetical protein